MVGFEELGDSSWGGVGGHGLLRATTDSFAPSKKLEVSLIGEPGCGSSALVGREGSVKLLPGASGLPVFKGRMGNMVVKRRAKNRGKEVGG
jgi:hypothetical protein